MAKIAVGVLGATGMVGQKYVSLLENHPWFEVKYLAASPRSAGKSYEEAVEGRWHAGPAIPESVRKLIVHDASKIKEALKECSFVFSALEMDKEAIKTLEMDYAGSELPVVSNASAHRTTDDVPMLIPEINASHLDLIEYQRKARGLRKGFVVVKPNCSIQSYMIPLYALIQAGYPVERIIVTTLQAVSGAGYPGVASLDMIDNIVPYIGGEEEKTEREPRKIFGSVKDGKILPSEFPKASACCTRVPVTDGHTACVSMEFGVKKPSLEEIKAIWTEFRSVPQELKLPIAPDLPIVYREEIDRPQPRKDRDFGKAMAVSVGRLRTCPVFDFRFVGLSHNTVRGAAGGGILNAELLAAKGFIS